jgi:hypothetical protein
LLRSLGGDGSDAANATLDQRPDLRWSGFSDYAPIGDLLEEHVAILLVRGTADLSVPVAGSRSDY